MDDPNDMIDRLCTYAAMILEDVHEITLIRPANVPLGDRVHAIYAAGKDVVTLSEAATVILARYAESDALLSQRSI